MDQLFILVILLCSVALAHWLAQKPVGRAIGGAILVIVIVALAANTGVIPTASNAPPLYRYLISVGAPVSIFWLLLEVRLSAVRQAGLPMLLLFALGAIATMSGVFIAGWLTGADAWLGEWFGPLSGMFTATYIGGGANFNALALHYEFVEAGNIFAAATVVDHVVTVLWVAALLILPRLIHRLAGQSTPAGGEHTNPQSKALADNGSEAEVNAQKRPAMGDLAVLLAMAFAAHWASLVLSAWSASLGLNVPSILILTSLALVVAQLPVVHRLQGTQMLGMYGAYLFLGTLGAYCELSALLELGRLGLLLLLFVALAVLLHGLIMFAGGRLLRQPPELVAIASAANVGGSTIVLPLAQSFKRMDLLLPGILVGSLGNGLGTYLGFLMVRLVSG